MSLTFTFTVETDEINAQEIDALTVFIQKLKPVEKNKLVGFAPKKEEPKEEAPKKTRRAVKPNKVEEPKVEEPKVEEPKVEEPKKEEPKKEEPKKDSEALTEELLKELRAHAVKLISANKDSVLKGVLAKYGVKAISKLPKSGAEELLAESAE